jgi:hypothetical protein
MAGRLQVGKNDQLRKFDENDAFPETFPWLLPSRGLAYVCP